MKILVNGIGNIGTTLLGVLNKFRNDLNISHVYAYNIVCQRAQHTELLGSKDDEQSEDIFGMFLHFVHI